jgi:hypothetical protein
VFQDATVEFADMDSVNLGYVNFAFPAQRMGTFSSQPIPSPSHNDTRSVAVSLVREQQPHYSEYSASTRCDDDTFVLRRAARVHERP